MPQTRETIPSHSLRSLLHAKMKVRGLSTEETAYRLDVAETTLRSFLDATHETLRTKIILRDSLEQNPHLER